MGKPVIFTDLDGTLLDPTTYGSEAAGEALRAIEARDIPLIFVSSKTRAEIEVYRNTLHNHHPFVTENGGGLFIPSEYFAEPAGTSIGAYQLITLGSPHELIREKFIELRERTGASVRGFSDMSADEIATLTGLTVEAARLAKQREFEEPFVFDGNPDPAFLKAIEDAGLRWTQGRIFHIMGRHHKGAAIQTLKRLYEQKFDAITTIGLGDSLNDLSMLMKVDCPVLIRHDDGSFDERIDLPNLIRSTLPGPTGWNATILQLLEHETIASSPVANISSDLRTIFDAALSAVDPYAAVLNSIHIEDDVLHVMGKNYPLPSYDRILVIGAGKSAARMSQAIEHLLGSRITQGLVITKYGHALPTQFVRIAEAAHPVPDEAGIAATHKLLQLVQGIDTRTLIICLLSGGASALMVAPAEGITLQDKQQATNLLLRAGASIVELNAVRKHLSDIKGGWLAQHVHPATLLTLILSDVIGDRLDVIASGPTAADASTFADALAVIAGYGLNEQMPAAVMHRLRFGKEGQLSETAKEGDYTLSTTQNVIVGNLDLALSAAEAQARALDYETRIVEHALQGEAREAARMMAHRARSELAAMKEGEKHCLIWGGETTVTVHGSGKGGRNQELALAFAMEIEGVSGLTLLSAGTDGTDGPTDTAGASVNGNTVPQARRLDIAAEPCLAQNDSYSFFHRLDAVAGTDCHIITGPTGTNVMDLQIMLLNKPSVMEATS